MSDTSGTGSAAVHDGPSRLIVNADDLGRTPGINAGIFAAHRRGIVTSATLMVAYPAAEAAAEEARSHPDLGIGLHVQLSGGRPLSPRASVPSLVDGEGRLPRKPDGLGGVGGRDLAREVRCQVDRFHQLMGRPPSHLDSHHHAHRLPRVCDVLVAVAHEHGLPVRTASAEVGARLASAGVATTDAFVEDFFDDRATVDTLLRVIAALGSGTTELMCHPAQVDDELRATSTYAAPRDREREVLCDPFVADALTRHGVRLCRFDEIATP